MAFEKKVRSVGNKSITYPWLRRYVVIGPYNRRVRRDLSEKLLIRALATAAGSAMAVRRRRAGKGPTD
jgi:hypothetical protein